MGACFSCHVTIGRKVYDVKSESDKGSFSTSGYGDCGASKVVSMYCQKGKKEENQDAMTVLEEFTGDEEMMFCGVFDGHGPLGQKYSHMIRDNLPSKLSAAIKMSQQKIHDDADDDDEEEMMSFASWEKCFVKSFAEMDEHLAKNIDCDGYCGGSTAVTLVKQAILDAILCTKAEDNNRIPVQLTFDLKPNVPSEAKRIIDCGGRVFATYEDPGVERIWMPEEDIPGLAMSRAFADFCLKDHGLTSLPDVIYRRINKQDEFVVLATDGIWDVLSNNEVINIVASAPKRCEAAKWLVKNAVKAWRSKYPRCLVDDCTVICLFLNNN